MVKLFFDIRKSMSSRDKDFEDIEKYNTNHDARGRFTYGTVVGGISNHTMRQGGMSVHVKTGKEPKSGYMVAAHADRSRWISAKEARDPDTREAAIRKFMKDNADLLSQKDNYLGTWLDPDTGMISLDISTCMSDKNAAIDYAREHNEKAIWDIGNAENISTGGTGSNLPPQ